VRLKILVTGANGPLGWAVKKESLNRSKMFEFLFTGSKELELTDSKAVMGYLDFHRPDVVMHLAAKSGGANLNKLIPVDMFEINIKMTMNILSASVKSNVSKVLLISSTAAYPTNREHPATENQLHIGSPSDQDFPYAFAKRMMEPLAKSYRTQYGLEVSVAIVNGIVGPAMNFKEGESVMLAGLIRRFFEQQQLNGDNQKYLVHGDGTPIREYTYSKDVASALFWLIEQKNMPELINIGNSKGYSVREYAEFVCSSLKIDPALIEFSELPGSAVKKYNQMTDNSYFKQLSNFQYTDIESAIDLTAEWLIENYPKIAR
jgi:GDP-L-fucose synthase